MKKLFWVLGVVLLSACGTKKKTSEASTGESLEQRLNGFMAANQNLDFEKIIDYTYPKVFGIASRETVMKELKDGFSSEEMEIKMDSLKVIKIHPVFKLDGGEYAKVEYSMIMLMDVKGDEDATAIPADTIESADPGTNTSEPASETALMVSLLEGQYGKGNVSADTKTGIIKINMLSEMAAMKDKHSKDWTFINFKGDDQRMLDRLMSKELQEKFASYQ